MATINLLTGNGKRYDVMLTDPATSNRIGGRKPLRFYVGYGLWALDEF